MIAGQTVRLTVNGQAVTRQIPAGQLLLDFLRQELDLTGSKEACGVGVCGLCTVLMDGATISACLLPAVCAQGRDIWTIEGITALQTAPPPLPPGAPDPALLREVQRAFLECEGLQCGICTTGQLMSAFALLTENPSPDEGEIGHFMAGNLCRCTGYLSIQRSIRQAAERWASRRAGLTGRSPANC